jgi:hypothetical protein
MNHEKEIAALEAEWSPETGFFWRIRQGQFAQSEFERVLDLVSGIRIEGDALPRRLVSLLWYAPTFMHWQVERVQSASGDAQSYRAAVDRMTTAIEQLLGVP